MSHSGGLPAAPSRDEHMRGSINKGTYVDSRNTAEVNSTLVHTVIQAHYIMKDLWTNFTDYLRSMS